MLARFEFGDETVVPAGVLIARELVEAITRGDPGAGPG